MINTEKVKSGVKKLTLVTILALTPVMCGTNASATSKYDLRTNVMIFYYNNSNDSQMMFRMQVNDFREEYFRPWSATPTRSERIYNAVQMLY
jgi:hypothetical protein